MAMVAMEIANAGLLEAELLASETADAGLQRLGKCAHSSLQKLCRVKADEELASKLAKCLRESLEVLDHRVHIELKATASVLRLVKTSEETILRPKIEKLQQILLIRKSQLGG